MFEVAWYGHGDRYIYRCRTYEQAQKEAKMRSISHMEAYVWNPDKQLIEVWRLGNRSEVV